MDIKQLRAFLTVADTGNVTRAAEILNLVQPAVSRQLRMLEEDLGIPLFERKRHGMVLNAAGQALAEHARRIMLDLDRARAELRADAGAEINGLVTLGLLPSTTDMLSSALLTAVAVSYPGIRLRLAVGYTGTLRRWLAAGEIDAALLYGAEKTDDVDARPLIEEALWAIAPAQARLRHDQPVQLSSLATQKLVLPSAPHGLRTLVEHACAVSQVTLQIAAETNSFGVQRRLVLDGHGWTILPPSAVAEDLATRRLSGAPLIDPRIMRTVVMALPNNRATGKAIKSAVDVLVEVVRSTVQSGTWLEGRWLG
ncbi:LysR family transcriptional regulator [Bordetella sp. N]|uniref:LysR family transcriptional regulator n=1 Tax=Bordetella sp. N TaxID=1746199 RepID=UPI00070AF965|nr:LysR family transcriptional regulator [Bordetella sp. N]ALM83458.1 LysR family transcriptional regulator [Bordetella sp. N]